MMSSAALRLRHRRIMRILRVFFGVQIVFSVGLAALLHALRGDPVQWWALLSGGLVGVLLLPAARRALRWLYIPLLLGIDLIHVTLLLWNTPLAYLQRGSLWALAYIPVLVAAGRWWGYAGGSVGLLIVLLADGAVLFARLPWRDAWPVFIFQMVTAALGTWASAQGEARARREILHQEALSLSNERLAFATHAHQQLATQLHSIGAILLEADAELPADPTSAERLITSATTRTRTALAIVQRSLRGLRPSPLGERTLPEVLAHELSLLRAEYGLESSFRCDGHLPPLRPSVAEFLFRAAQEALDNVRTHAHAQRVEVDLHGDHAAIVLLVCDDGLGFDSESLVHDGGHWGLLGLRARASELGGELLLQSTPGAGTRVEVRLPIQRR